MITEQQIKERRLGIGGSDMPIIMGLSSYKTAYQLYLEKIGESDLSEEITEQQYWGNVLEGVIRNEFCKRNNILVKEPKDTIIHPIHDFLRANIDGYIPDWNAVLEIKCSCSFMANSWGEEESDSFPIQYLLQVAHYCAVTNSDFAYIAVLIGGNKYKQFRYIRDLEIESKLIDAAKTFWNCVQNRTPPDPINQFDLRTMYPNHVPEKSKSMSSEIEEDLKKLIDVRLKIKSLNDSEENHKFNIMKFMKDSESLIDSSGKLVASWKTNKRGTRTFLMRGI